MKPLLLAALLLTALTPAMAEAQGPAPLGFRSSRAPAGPVAAPPVASSGSALGATQQGSRVGSKVLKGALYGSLLGFAIGVVAVATHEDTDGDQGVVIVIPGMTAIGAGVGAVIGLAGGLLGGKD